MLMRRTLTAEIERGPLSKPAAIKEGNCGSVSDTIGGFYAPSGKVTAPGKGISQGVARRPARFEISLDGILRLND